MPYPMKNAVLDDQFALTGPKKFKKTVLQGAKHSGVGKMALRNESQEGPTPNSKNKSSNLTLMTKDPSKKLELQGQNMHKTQHVDKNMKKSQSHVKIE